MTDTHAPISWRLTPSVSAVLDQVYLRETDPPVEIRRTVGYCNELIEVQLSGGDSLILKRARFDWGSARLSASRAAASLLRRRTGVVVPSHLDIDNDALGRAIEAYWRIPLPTLKEVWATIPEKRQPQALRSWGALMRRIHKATPGRYGALHDAGDEHRLERLLHADLNGRLRPALECVWPDAVSALGYLLNRIDRIGDLLATRPAVLVHNDFHMGNVLCEQRPRSIRCVGVIDLESAWAGPAESDIAQLQVLHGPAFGNPLPEDWFTHFARGYGSELDEELLSFFRILHILNLGYFAADSGWVGHVRDLEAELAREINGCPIGADGASSADPR